VKINLGAHGQLQGMGAHWELWMLVQGGMKPLEALHSATITGAAYLGMDDQIGSLKAGKLADLIVLDKNPLDDIANSNTLVYTVINGRVYDANTLNETGNYTTPRKKFYWEQNKYSQNFPWHEETHSFQSMHCSCQTMH